MRFTVGSTPANIFLDVFEKSKVGINTNIVYCVSNLKSYKFRFICNKICIHNMRESRNRI